MRVLTLTLGGALASIALCAVAAPPPRAADAKAVAFKAVCGKCHDMAVVTSTPRSFDAWGETVQKMFDHGAKGTDAQWDAVMGYLYENLSTLDVNTAQTSDLASMLHVARPVAGAIVARRAQRPFTDLADLKSIPGVDPAVVDAKAKMIFF